MNNHTTTTTTLKSFVLGFVLAALLLPATGYAQWTVFDPANYTFQVSKKLEEFNRWLETVRQYTQMYENAVGQLTNLQGILRTVDDALANERQMRRFLSYWGQAVRLVFRVKNQLVNLVTGAARAVLNIAASRMVSLIRQRTNGILRSICATALDGPHKTRKPNSSGSRRWIISWNDWNTTTNARPNNSRSWLPTSRRKKKNWSN